MPTILSRLSKPLPEQCYSRRLVDGSVDTRHSKLGPISTQLAGHPPHAHLLSDADRVAVTEVDFDELRTRDTVPVGILQSADDLLGLGVNHIAGVGIRKTAIHAEGNPAMRLGAHIDALFLDGWHHGGVENVQLLLVLVDEPDFRLIRRQADTVTAAALIFHALDHYGMELLAGSRIANLEAHDVVRVDEVERLRAVDRMRPDHRHERADTLDDLVGRCVDHGQHVVLGRCAIRPFAIKAHDCVVAATCVADVDLGDELARGCVDDFVVRIRAPPAGGHVEFPSVGRDLNAIAAALGLGIVVLPESFLGDEIHAGEFGVSVSVVELVGHRTGTDAARATHVGDVDGSHELVPVVDIEDVDPMTFAASGTVRNGDVEEMLFGSRRTDRECRQTEQQRSQCDSK